ncbi:MAG: serine hydrolase [Steroidobacteraceae bacterium]
MKYTIAVGVASLVAAAALVWWDPAPDKAPVAPLPAAAPAHAGPVGIARVTFNRDGLLEQSAAGFADAAAKRLLNVEDPVRVASISKLVVAIGVMRLVEQGKLDLDADVSQQLGWTLRHPGWPQTPITLRLLLSHRASLTDRAGYWQVPLGGQFRELLADPKAWDDGHAPGTFWRYANVGFPLVAAVMERATGERFDQLMERLVLGPLSLNACYNWDSCPTETVARGVVLYSDGKPVRDDHHGVRPPCAVSPAADGSCDLKRWRAGENGALFSPQGGLRISAAGLATVGRLLLGDGSVDGIRLLTPASMLTLTTPVWTYQGGNGVPYEEDGGKAPAKGFTCRYGLAVQTLATAYADCGDDPFGDGVPRIGHAGEAYGVLSGLWVDRASGTGVAYFATGMNDAPAGRRSSFSAIEEAMARGR